MSSSFITRLSGASSLGFKCENLQKTGSFKVRGATHAALRAPDVKKLITHSSGNHAQAVAFAGQAIGADVTVVMPFSAPEVKRIAVQDTYGAKVVSVPQSDRQRKTDELCAKDPDLLFVHPSNDLAVIAGQGTMALEIMQQAPETQVLFCPVGGGGLLSGTLLACSESPHIQVIAVEPEVVDDASRSMKEGRICANTAGNSSIADGLNTTLGSNTFAILQKFLKHPIVLVTEEEIRSAQKLIAERMKLIVEPSGAVALAGLLKSKEMAQGKRVVAVICGGNCDIPF